MTSYSDISIASKLYMPPKIQKVLEVCKKLWLQFSLLKLCDNLTSSSENKENFSLNHL